MVALDNSKQGKFRTVAHSYNVALLF